MNYEIPTAADYPDDLWEYLPPRDHKLNEVFQDLPSRTDRDKLVERARNAEKDLKRVQLWNYFFRFDQEKVGRDQERSIRRLEARLDDERRQVGETIEQLELQIRDLEVSIPRLEQELAERKEELREKHDRQHAAAKRAVMATKVIGHLLLVFGMFLAVCSSLPILGGFDRAGWWVGSILICAAPFLLAGILMRQLAKKRYGQLPKMDLVGAFEQVEGEARTEQQECRNRIEESLSRVDEEKAGLLAVELEVERKSRDLQEQVRRLRAQIPQQRPIEKHSLLDESFSRVPSDDEVADWLMQDIRDLKRRALEETGMTGRVGSRILRSDHGRGDDGELSNVFCIPGPAELQDFALIPTSYTVTTDSDRAKHLNARRYARLSDDRWADFHPVYAIQFLIVADDVLASYRTTWDFVDGRQRGEEARSYHYADVVGVYDFRGSRELKNVGDFGGTGQSVHLDNAPTLQLSLTSGESLNITWVSREYFEETGAPAGFDSDLLLMEPTPTAENAIKAVRQRVDDAKRKRQWHPASPD